MRLLTILVGDFPKDSSRESQIRKAIMCQPKAAWLETVNIRHALAETQRLCPKVVWIDLKSFSQSSINLIVHLKRLDPEPYIILTTTQPDVEFVRKGLHLAVTDVFCGDFDKELQSFVERIERQTHQI